MIALLGVACAFAGGAWFVASAVWPAPRPLSSALSNLNSTVRSRLGFVSVEEHDESAAVAVGRWLVRHAKATTLADEQTASDLELLGRPLEMYAGTRALLQHAPARDFVADAFQHCKFIGHSTAAKSLLDKAGVQPDAGVVVLAGKKDVDAFVGALGALRLWDREPKVKLQPEPAPVRGRPASAAAR